MNKRQATEQQHLRYLHIGARFQGGALKAMCATRTDSAQSTARRAKRADSRDNAEQVFDREVWHDERGLFDRGHFCRGLHNAR